jgi:hypothetical protein
MSDKQNARILRQLDEITELRRDKERLDWLDATRYRDPMRAERCGGVRGWLCMGTWYDGLRAAIDAAIKEEADASK